jgi:hypothetical protein
MSRIRKLACGHSTIGVRDYTDDYRWSVHCGECGLEERWTQREWRSVFASVPPLDLIKIVDEDKLAIA